MLKTVKMAAVNVTLVSVAGENSNSTIDTRPSGMKTDPECQVGVSVLPANGEGQTVSSCPPTSIVTLNPTYHRPTASQPQQALASSSLPHASVTVTVAQHNHVGNAVVPGVVCTTVANSNNVHETLKQQTVLTEVQQPFTSVVLTNATRPLFTPGVVSVPRVRLNSQPVSAVSSVPTNLRTLAPRLVVNSSSLTTLVRVQPPTVSGNLQTVIQTSSQALSAAPAQQQIVMPIRATTQGQLINRVRLSSSAVLLSM